MKIETRKQDIQSGHSPAHFRGLNLGIIINNLKLIPTKSNFLKTMRILFFCNVIRVQLIYNIVLVSGVQHSGSIYIYIHSRFFRLFSHMLLQNTEQSYTCYTVGPCWLLILYAVVCVSEKGNGNPLQYSCLENPVDRGAWQATVHSIAKSRT